MTVTIYIDLTVECDFCDGKKISQTLAEKEGRIDTVFLARFHSRNRGWDVVNGNDICPECQKSENTSEKASESPISPDTYLITEIRDIGDKCMK